MNNNIDTQKINSTLRSIYRLKELQKMMSPDILIDAEKQILLERVRALSALEILAIIDAFPEYYHEQCQQAAEDDQIFMIDFDQFIGNLN